MNFKLAKYEFTSEAQALEKIASFIDTKHTFIKLGFIQITPPIYDINDVLLTPATYSTKCSVDAVWDLQDVINEDSTITKVDHPYGWKTYAIDVVGNGSHSIAGVDFQCYKIGA